MPCCSISTVAQEIRDNGADDRDPSAVCVTRLSGELFFWRFLKIFEKMGSDPNVPFWVLQKKYKFKWEIIRNRTILLIIWVWTPGSPKHRKGSRPISTGHGNNARNMSDHFGQMSPPAPCGIVQVWTQFSKSNGRLLENCLSMFEKIGPDPTPDPQMSDIRLDLAPKNTRIVCSCSSVQIWIRPPPTMTISEQMDTAHPGEILFCFSHHVKLSHKQLENVTRLKCLSKAKV